jgi:predicted PhzF superfamily epimerase YddE/YHI9
MDQQSITVIDAFTQKPFAGNPAAVCILKEPRSDAWLQTIAREMNLSETAFLWPLAQATYRLRWFTPKIEVKLCGHATLASAHLIWERNIEPIASLLKFETLSGTLTAQYHESGWIALDFPSRPAEECACPPELRESLQVEPLYCARHESTYLVEVDGKDALLAIQPDFNLMLRTGFGRAIVTSRAAPSEPFDFVSRFFAPDAGINEDPVTGSAHCILGPYWAWKLGKRELMAFQASGRGGELRLTVGDTRTILRGQAVTVLKGQLAVGS